MVPPPHPQTLVLQLPEQSLLQAANWGAVHSPRLPATSPGVPDVPIATLAALLPREDEVNVDNMESKTLDSCSASRTESSFLDQCPERGNYLEEGLPQQLSFNSCSEEEDDFNYDYELNRERPEAHCKSLSIKPLSLEDNLDLGIWISQFEDVIFYSLNPHSKRRHDKYCLKWLPGHLNDDAYAIWKRHKSCNNWEQLKNKLLLEYEDPTFRMEWKSNPLAYIWDEDKETLTSYCSKVKRYVDAFDTDIAEVPKAKRNQYYRRFFNGLPPDYQNEVRMRTSSKKVDVDKALDICLRYQSLRVATLPLS